MSKKDQHHSSAHHSFAGHLMVNISRQQQVEMIYHWPYLLSFSAFNESVPEIPGDWSLSRSTEHSRRRSLGSHFWRKRCCRQFRHLRAWVSCSLLAGSSLEVAWRVCSFCLCCLYQDIPLVCPDLLQLEGLPFEFASEECSC